jgi:nitrogenase molybdenum-iron protein beta chain
VTKLIEQPRHFCALAGQQTVAAIERAIPIVHAGPGCGHKLHCGMAMFNGFQGSGYAGGSAIVSTNTGEREIVFGGEGWLREAIEGALKVMDGDLFVVLTGCTADLVGDDAAQVVSEFRARGLAVAHAETGGFKGNGYFGHERVLEALLEQLVEPCARTIPGLVNVWSTVPYQDTFWAGNLAAVRALLASLGLEANVLFGPGSGGLAAWREIPAAQFNLVLSSWVGLAAAESLKARFGTPLLHWPSLPIGGAETSRFLRAVGAFAGVAEPVIAASIRRHEAAFYYYFERAADFFMEFRWDLPGRFGMVADSFYAAGIARFLTNEFGLLPGHQVLTDDPPEEHRERIGRSFADIAPGISADVTFASDGGLIRSTLKSLAEPPSLLLGTSWDREIAGELGAAHLSIALPVTDRLVLNAAYLGYDGGLRLIEDVYASILSSVQ